MSDACVETPTVVIAIDHKAYSREPRNIDVQAGQYLIVCVATDCYCVYITCSPVWSCQKQRQDDCEQRQRQETHWNGRGCRSAHTAATYDLTEPTSAAVAAGNSPAGRNIQIQVITANWIQQDPAYSNEVSTRSTSS